MSAVPRGTKKHEQYTVTNNSFLFALRDDKLKLKVVERAQYAKLAAQGMYPGQIRKALGIEKGNVGGALMKAYGRAAGLSDEEKQRLAELPAPATDGSVEHQVLKMRERGLGYDNISFVLGIDPHEARKMFDAQIERYAASELLDADKARLLLVNRLEKMYADIEHRMAAGNVGAVLAGIKIVERLAKLLGLDAATRVNIEARLREAAREAGLDEEVVISEAITVIRREPVR
jgi:hypothetical protein